MSLTMTVIDDRQIRIKNPPTQHEGRNEVAQIQQTLLLDGFFILETYLDDEDTGDLVIEARKYIRRDEVNSDDR